MDIKTCKKCAYFLKNLNVCTNEENFIKGKARIIRVIPSCDKFSLTKKKKDTYNSKYHSKKEIIDNIVFDSKSEARRYKDLKILERAGKITDLKLQPVFPLLLSDKETRNYKADFMYFEKETGKTVVEDVKGVKTPVYKLKKVRFLHLYPQYDFREILY